MTAIATAAVWAERDSRSMLRPMLPTVPGASLATSMTTTK